MEDFNEDITSSPEEAEDYERHTSMRVPHKLIDEIRDFQKQQISRIGREPTQEEIERFIGSRPQHYNSRPEVVQLLANFAIQPLAIFDAEPTGLAPMEMAGPDTTSDDALDRVEAEERIAALHIYLQKLSPKYRRIIIDRYGLEGQKKILKEIGLELGTSASYIQQAENLALRQLRRSFNVTLFPDLSELADKTFNPKK